MRLLEKLGQATSRPTSRPASQPTPPSPRTYTQAELDAHLKNYRVAQEALTKGITHTQSRAEQNASHLRNLLQGAEDRAFSAARNNEALRQSQRLLEGQLGDATSKANKLQRNLQAATKDKDYNFQQMKSLQKDKDYNFQQMNKFRASDAARKQNAINMQLNRERRLGKTRTLGAGVDPTRGSNVEDAVIKKLEAAKNTVKAAPGNAARGVKNTVGRTIGGVDAGVRSVGSSLKNLAPQELRQMGASVGSSRDDVNDRIIGGTAIGGAAAAGGGLGVRKILQARAAREAASRVSPTLLQKLRLR